VKRAETEDAMSEVETDAARTEPTSVGGRDKRAWAEEVLGELLRLTGLRARLEVKEIAPAQGAPTLSVALFPEEEMAGLHPGKRSPLVESIQFLANKIVNRGPEKKWITIGVGSHPEPRPPAPKGAPPPPSSRAQPRAVAPPVVRPERAEKATSERAPELDESALEVDADPLLESAGRALAEKASLTGRLYAVAPMKPEDRARLFRAGRGVTGASVKVEGEGRHRRVVFVPANPKPMPKKSTMPDYDIEDDSEE
jgi:predicted RNA-binding protein Jag